MRADETLRLRERRRARRGVTERQFDRWSALRACSERHPALVKHRARWRALVRVLKRPRLEPYTLQMTNYYQLVFR